MEGVLAGKGYMTRSDRQIAVTGLRGNCALAASSCARLLTHALSHAHTRTAELDALKCTAGRARTREDARTRVDENSEEMLPLHCARHERRRMLLRGVRVA
jgi:hypothetical protein